MLKKLFTVYTVSRLHITYLDKYQQHIKIFVHPEPVAVSKNSHLIDLQQLCLVLLRCDFKTLLALDMQVIK